MTDYKLYDLQKISASDKQWSIDGSGWLLDKQGSDKHLKQGRIVSAILLRGRKSTKGDDDEDDLIVMDVRGVSRNQVRYVSNYCGPLAWNKKTGLSGAATVMRSHPGESRAQRWQGSSQTNYA